MSTNEISQPFSPDPPSVVLSQQHFSPVSLGLDTVFHMQDNTGTWDAGVPVSEFLRQSMDDTAESLTLEERREREREKLRLKRMHCYHPVVGSFASSRKANASIPLEKEAPKAKEEVFVPPPSFAQAGANLLLASQKKVMLNGHSSPSNRVRTPSPPSSFRLGSVFSPLGSTSGGREGKKRVRLSHSPTFFLSTDGPKESSAGPIVPNQDSATVGTSLSAPQTVGSSAPFTDNQNQRGGEHQPEGVIAHATLVVQHVPSSKTSRYPPLEGHQRERGNPRSAVANLSAQLVNTICQSAVAGPSPQERQHASEERQRLHYQLQIEDQLRVQQEMLQRGEHVYDMTERHNSSILRPSESFAPTTFYPDGRVQSPRQRSHQANPTHFLEIITGAQPADLEDSSLWKGVGNHPDSDSRPTSEAQQRSIQQHLLHQHRASAVQGRAAAQNSLNAPQKKGPPPTVGPLSTARMSSADTRPGSEGNPQGSVELSAGGVSHHKAGKVPKAISPLQFHQLETKIAGAMQGSAESAALSPPLLTPFAAMSVSSVSMPSPQPAQGSPPGAPLYSDRIQDSNGKNPRTKADSVGSPNRTTTPSLKASGKERKPRGGGQTSPSSPPVSSIPPPTTLIKGGGKFSTGTFATGKYLLATSPGGIRYHGPSSIPPSSHRHVMRNPNHYSSSRAGEGAAEADHVESSDGRPSKGVQLSKKLKGHTAPLHNPSKNNAFRGGKSTTSPPTAVATAFPSTDIVNGVQSHAVGKDDPQQPSMEVGARPATTSFLTVDGAGSLHSGNSGSIPLCKDESAMTFTGAPLAEATHSPNQTLAQRFSIIVVGNPFESNNTLDPVQKKTTQSEEHAPPTLVGEHEQHSPEERQLQAATHETEWGIQEGPARLEFLPGTFLIPSRSSPNGGATLCSSTNHQNGVVGNDVPPHLQQQLLGLRHTPSPHTCSSSLILLPRSAIASPRGGELLEAEAQIASRYSGFSPMENPLSFSPDSSPHPRSWHSFGSPKSLSRNPSPVLAGYPKPSRKYKQTITSIQTNSTGVSTSSMSARELALQQEMEVLGLHTSAHDMLHLHKRTPEAGVVCRCKRFIASGA